MKKLIFALFAIIIVIVGGTLVYEKLHPTTSQILVPPEESAVPQESLNPDQSMLPETSPVATSAPVANEPTCSPDNLQAIFETDAGAGNIYGTLSIKNISTQRCVIIGNEYVIPQVTAQNVTMKKQGEPGPQNLVLAPNQTVYSQIHYPNGPQCSGPTKAETVAFTYPIANSQAVVFKDDSGDVTEQIQVCASSEKTQIDVWSISLKPVTQ